MPNLFSTFLKARICKALNWRFRGLSLYFQRGVQCSVLMVIFPTAGIASPLQSGTAAMFKQFISSPPPFEMVVEVCDRKSGAGDNKDVSCYFVLLRYQKNGILYREAPNLLDLSTQQFFPNYRLAGYYGDEYWTFSLDGSTLGYSTNSESSKGLALKHIVAKASPLFHMGIFGALPRTISWNGNQIRSFTNYYGVKIDGNLELSSNSVPKRLVLSTEYRSNSAPWEITYDYGLSTTLPDYLPGKISGWSLRGAKRVLKFELSILSVELHQHPLSKEYFMPDSFSKRVIYRVISTPTGDYVHDKWNKNLGSASHESKLVASIRSRRTTVMLLFIFANVLIISAVLFVKWRRLRNQTHLVRKEFK
jgi:hypothetical protein